MLHELYFDINESKYIKKPTGGFNRCTWDKNWWRGDRGRLFPYQVLLQSVQLSPWKTLSSHDADCVAISPLVPHLPPGAPGSTVILYSLHHFPSTSVSSVAPPPLWRTTVRVFCLTVSSFRGAELSCREGLSLRSLAASVGSWHS